MAAKKKIPSSSTGIVKRKAALKTADVTKQIKELLNTGKLESGSLAEWLVVDHSKLLDHVFSKTEFSQFLPQIKKELSLVKKLTSMSATKIIGARLASIITKKEDRQSVRSILIDHPSDTVRGWCCIFIGEDTTLTDKQKIKTMIPLADDSHFGVKEMAWMGLRNGLIRDLSGMLELLAPLALNKSENIRRFASEISRPCGVWCSHLNELKKSPELGMLILEPLRADPSRYVQNSVGNWLNDAGKSDARWVRDVCSRWLVESPVKETAYICKRGMRSFS